MNKPVHLGLSILQSNKILMHKFWYDYLKQKYIVKNQNCLYRSS